MPSRRGSSLFFLQRRTCSWREWKFLLVHPLRFGYMINESELFWSVILLAPNRMSVSWAHIPFVGPETFRCGCFILDTLCRCWNWALCMCVGVLLFRDRTHLSLSIDAIFGTGPMPKSTNCDVYQVFVHDPGAWAPLRRPISQARWILLAIVFANRRYLLCDQSVLTRTLFVQWQHSVCCVS